MGDGTSQGSLSDRLNPSHSKYDKSLKQTWKSFTKKERKAIVTGDKQRLQDLVSATAQIVHPFNAVGDDHCETGAEAYKDIATILTHVAKLLRKKPATLQIYDPYFCAGSMVSHMKEVGFDDVYNRNEDFYATVRKGRVPPHDVVVTNPPYSGDHVEKLLKWCRSNGKPFLILMPTYFCKKPYYEEALGGAASSLLYLFPRKRYMYWTPKGLRNKDKVQSQHAGAGGNRTSPFVSFWYIDLGPLSSPPR